MFSGHEERLEHLAVERSKVLGELVKFTEWNYIPAEQPASRQILVLSSFQGTIGLYTAYRLEKEPHDIMAQFQAEWEQLKGKKADNPEVGQLAGQIVQKGTNVALLHLDPDIDVLLQINKVVNDHAAKLPEQ
jgi:hypothetical protein